MTTRDIQPQDLAAGALTAGQRETFERDGYLILPDALTRPELVALRRKAHTLAFRETAPLRRWVTSAHRRLPRGPRIPVAVPLGILGSIEFQNVLSQSSLLHLIDKPSMLAAVTNVLGWNIYVYLATLVHSPTSPSAAPTGPIGWHQDSSRVNDELEGAPRPRLSVKIAYFLTDTRPDDCGQMWILPGSHRSNSPPATAMPDGACPLRVEPGTAVLFDRRLWHSASANHTRHPRQVVFIGYAYRWLRPHDSMTVRHLWRSASPVRRQLLGAGSDATSFYSPCEHDVPLKALWHVAQAATFPGE